MTPDPAKINFRDFSDPNGIDYALNKKNLKIAVFE